VDEGLGANLIVRIALSPRETSGIAEVLLKDPSGAIVTSRSSIEVKGGAALAAFNFVKGEVELWYPVGYGEQPLYDVQVKVFDDVRSLFSEKNLNLFTRLIFVGKAVTRYQDPKDWVPPRARY
jgi:beta-mannosidase